MNDYTCYAEKLEDERWFQKRTEIHKRDKCMCRMCGASKDLNVHHRYYLYKNDPWDHPDEALITLCERCHKLVHITLSPLIYVVVKGQLVRMNFTPCSRCHGTGYFPEYRKIQNGICFRCRGECYEELSLSVVKMELFIDNAAEIFDSLAINPKAESLFLQGKCNHHNNPLNAKQLYFDAAVAGCGKAQNNLGLILKAEGDLESAKRWFLYAAMQGIGQAKLNIGRLLDEQGDCGLLKEWVPVLSNDNHVKCGIALENFAEFTNSGYQKPSLNVVLSSVDTLINIATDGYEPAVQIVEKFKIREMQKSLYDIIEQLQK